MGVEPKMSPDSTDRIAFFILSVLRGCMKRSRMVGFVTRYMNQEKTPGPWRIVRSKRRNVLAARAGSRRQVSTTSAPCAALFIASHTPEENIGSTKANASPMRM